MILILPFPPRKSNEGLQFMFLSRNKKIYFRIILNTPSYLELRAYPRYLYQSPHVLTQIKFINFLYMRFLDPQIIHAYRTDSGQTA